MYGFYLKAVLDFNGIVYYIDIVFIEDYINILLYPTLGFPSGEERHAYKLR